ncbi:MAG: hydrogenase maturation protease [Candidatus Zixiibacteriota bacterium]|nr:MAG: hydrogenase maturation protease [candidate division Zixibacteria bacterium]
MPGSQGIALLGRLSGREAILFLDAISRGDPPGTIHNLDDTQIFAQSKTGVANAHKGGVTEILRAMALTNDIPRRVVAIGIEPGELSSRVGLSDDVESSLPAALSHSRSALSSLVEWYEDGKTASADRQAK